MQEAVEGKLSKKVEWQHRLARFAASGQPIKVFCQAERVSQAAFYRWRTYLVETGSAPEATAGFIDAGAWPAAREAPPMALIEPAKATLDVRLDFGHGLVLHIARR
ncbi:MAG: hypothetical protein EPN46_09210 [Candidimonas sp.]|nr:MAG: hypothetical protein EPN77_05380 [Candidimonas sp.]TAM25631.1 MAG: hypothetical protein EPN62_03560 [Candidimonas sp.]TAM76007.1 MAG: hypothetical protein EPN46_09210 [Candidimonas sp.]